MSFMTELNYRFKLRQKPYVILKENTQVFNTEQHHCNSLNAYAECITRILLTVYFTILKHVRVYHATAHNFYPSAVFANVTTLTMANYTGYIHLCTWFSKRKERRTK